MARREDGYHLLETVFYPVGIYNGTPSCPDPFCDIIEAVYLPDSKSNDYRFEGRRIDCPPEKNLVVRAAEAVSDATGLHFAVTTAKSLPDGAGLGGGSADATLTLTLLCDLIEEMHLSDVASQLRSRLPEIALSLGADCPFFLLNSPALGEGIGERLSPLPEKLKDMWCVIAKPDIYISTREAFQGVSPRRPAISVEDIYMRPVGEWKGLMTNDFEAGLFLLYPVLAEIKERLYASGAIYAQMSGSGASLFGIYKDEEAARAALRLFEDISYTAICRL